MLYKHVSGSAKDVDVPKGIVTGYLSSFDVKDDDGDIIQNGAYTKTVSENGPAGGGRIKHLLDHNRTQVPGVFQVLKEDARGLYMESKVGRHTLGQDVLKMYEDGIITEHSVCIIPVKEKKTSEGNVITEVKMKEGSSLQAWGANQYTPSMGVKSEADLLELIQTLEKALRSGTYSDETFLYIEKQFGQITAILKRKREATEPLFGTQPDTEGPLSLIRLFSKNLSNSL